MTMSNTTSPPAGQATTPAPGVEALRPARSLWSVGVVGLVGVLVAALVWVSPSLTQPRLQDWTVAGGVGSPSIGGIPTEGLTSNLLWTPVKMDAVGGITIVGVGSASTATIGGAWVLDSAQRDQLQAAVDTWYQVCVDDNGNLSGTAAMCQLPSGNAQSDALLATLVGLGAPLDAATAVPQHLANRMDGTLVVLPTTLCGSHGSGDVVFQTRRFGVPGSVVVYFPTWPSC